MTKEAILAEIKRTAAENGGKPLGRERFERITGIKAYHWSKYWARYSDALQDAGFEPNTMQGAYEDEYLLEKLANLAQELGKVPTNIEIRMKSFNDPNFPSKSAFERLGTKSQLLTKLKNYCLSKPVYADVVEIIGDLPEPSETNGVSSDARYGFVYLVRGHPGEYKIGRTNLVDRRLSELGATASVEQELIHEIKTDDPAGVEAYWHTRFAENRMRGEWFRLKPDDVKAFKRWKRIF